MTMPPPPGIAMLTDVNDPTARQSAARTRTAAEGVTEDARPLVAHVVYRFDTGGLENGIVNLINHMPAQAYRHAVVALTEVTDFRQRVRRQDIQYVSLHKPPGQGLWQFPKLLRMFRQLQPTIVHTRNLAALEAQVPAWLAGVPVRIHGEHGWDVNDLDGTNRRYQWTRRLYRPFVSHHIALSSDLRDYLVQRTGLAPARVTQICNGVDVSRFTPAPADGRPSPIPFRGQGLWIIGTVGRMQPVKDQLNLANAFAIALAQRPDLRTRLRLVMVGDGPLRSECQRLLGDAGLAELCWLPGERSDVADIMRGLNCFVLPSLAEGISNTILEAMASGLPVIATSVGGNADLIVPGETGDIVPANDPQALADALLRLADNTCHASTLGDAGRARAEQRFSIQAMVQAYQNLYDSQLRSTRR